MALAVVGGLLLGRGIRMADEREPRSATRFVPADRRAIAPVSQPSGAGRRRAVPLPPVGIVLAALNLRPAITSLGALLEEARAGLHMSGSVAGLLTSVPPLCFASAQL